MAADAIARQYDVDKNSVILFCEPVGGNYRPGTITFQAKKGRSIDLEKMRESIAATRLSGGTNMRVDRLEVTVRGQVAAAGAGLRLKASGTGQEFALAEDPDGSESLRRLQKALAGGKQVVSVTGRVRGWNGRFPDVLKAVAPDGPVGREGPTLLVTNFEVAGK
jgi:hypothetical protein